MTAPERRASILAAATEAFAARGYQRTKVAEIARQVGVSEPVVFQNFGTKAALFGEVLQHAATTVGDQLRRTAEDGRPVPDVLAHWLAPAHFDRLHARGALGALFADAVAHGAEGPTGDATHRALHTVAAAFADVLRRGQEAGSIRADLEPEAGAWWFISQLHAHGFRSATMPGREALEPSLQRLTLDALRPPPVS
nr:TetR/AcrR family transcriptional regulator [Streptomyces coryli]